MKTPRNLFIAAALLLVTIHTPCAAQNASINAAFDEIGTQRCAAAGPGEVNVYVVAYGLSEISGYEFELLPTEYPAFFLGCYRYPGGPAIPECDYDVRAGTGGCITEPTLMGPSDQSWTLVRFDLGYFAGIGADVFYCVGPSPGSGADTPQYTLCDPDATKAPFELFTSSSSDQYGGCAVANPTINYWDDCRIVSSENPSWGTLKAQFHE